MTTLFHHREFFVEFPTDDLEQSIPDRFEKQVERDPSHLAIQTRTQTLTYEQLNRAANVVAREILERRGKGQEPIALLLENDAPMIGAILGVLKAGKIYVPLDPSLPAGRLTYILQDSQAALLISNARNRELAASLTDGKVVVVELEQLDRHAGTGNPGISIPPDSPSWIIYTSGSTGQPKGVVQTHRNVLHFVKNYTNGLMLSSADRLSVLYSFGVNGAAHEMFSGLLNCASLHPLDIKTEGLSGLAAWLTDQRVTTYSSVPTVFRHFCETLTGAEELRDLRFVKLIGEPVAKREVDLYRRHFPEETIFINRLGSTETGTIRWYFIDKRTRIDGTSVPVGYAVADNDVMLLDEDKKQVAPGEIGEIAVKSRYLSPGYWRKPEQTAKAFLADVDGTSGRVYLTGDMGRFLPDGCLLHMGRKDFQVKIRGHRIETAEIEMALLSISEAHEAIVMAREDGQGDSRLVAYLLMPGRPRPSVSSLRRGLTGLLPAYMIPSVFMMLDRFPVAPNGKVNRGALPLPDASRPELESVFVAPSDSAQRQLAQIWREVLGVDAVGVHDDFLDLGGNSLLAVQLMARIEKTFGKQLLPAVIFRAPTIEQLAALIHEERDDSLPSIVALRSSGSKRPLFWVHGDSGSAFLPDYLDPDQPVYGLEHQSQDGKPAEYTRVDTIAEHYLRQIRKIQARGPYLLGGYSFGGTIAFEIAHHLRKEGEAIAVLALLDSLSPGTNESSASNDTSASVSRDSPSTISRLRKFTRLTFRDQVRHLPRFTDTLFSNRLRRTFKRLLCKLCLSAGWTLPVFVRSFYILEVYKRALENYSPLVFPGRAIYFKSMLRSGHHQERWRSLMKDGLVVYEVPGGHEDVVRRENVAVWGQRLRSCLSTAQTAGVDARFCAETGSATVSPPAREDRPLLIETASRATD